MELARPLRLEGLERGEQLLVGLLKFRQRCEDVAAAGYTGFEMR